jgi:hypothetical protein
MARRFPEQTRRSQTLLASAHSGCVPTRAYVSNYFQTVGRQKSALSDAQLFYISNISFELDRMAQIWVQQEMRLANSERTALRKVCQRGNAR